MSRFSFIACDCGNKGGLLALAGLAYAVVDGRRRPGGVALSDSVSAAGSKSHRVTVDAIAIARARIEESADGQYQQRATATIATPGARSSGHHGDQQADMSTLMR